ncbi:methyltransferase n6amt1 [Holotrichia oblita]|uniref:Methyltransferase n6amt1 n=2 Tax=Holotrichia oblita TaxID=644536 RepID=A0ACB9TLM1_HOLOL|nr:methyltransferase n6amt1 [Holotrichia oblita]KAI4467698.1 methyltransferase n6amt1 [Holotrichia oblita]
MSNIVQANPDFIVEIGSGSGVIITALAAVLKDARCFATDINPEACIATSNTSILNNVSVEVCNMTLLTCFKEYLFDVIVFNPPYVVTDTEEVFGNGIARAWAGGIDGCEVINQFLKLLPNLMSSKGICYLLLIKENKPLEIINMLYGMKFNVDIVKQRKVPCEHLYVLKIYK